jgi:hypothetical protein
MTEMTTMMTMIMMIMIMTTKSNRQLAIGNWQQATGNWQDVRNDSFGATQFWRPNIIKVNPATHAAGFFVYDDGLTAHSLSFKTCRRTCEKSRVYCSIYKICID